MATDRKTLSQFTIHRAGDGFSLHIEDSAGEVIEFEATAAQVDVIAEALEDLLEEDEEED